MLHFRPNCMWVICWKFTAPLVTLVCRFVIAMSIYIFSGTLLLSSIQISTVTISSRWWLSDMGRMFWIFPISNINRCYSIVCYLLFGHIIGTYLYSGKYVNISIILWLSRNWNADFNQITITIRLVCNDRWLPMLTSNISMHPKMVNIDQQLNDNPDYYR